MHVSHRREVRNQLSVAEAFRNPEGSFVFSSAYERKGVLKVFEKLEADFCPCIHECFGFSSNPVTFFCCEGSISMLSS